MNWKQVRCVGARLREILFPMKLTCEVCGKEVFRRDYLCEECREKLPYHRKFICTKCGRRIEEDYPVCVQCKAKMPHYTAARSVFDYEGEPVRLIKKFKTGARYLADFFAEEAEIIFRRYFDFADIVIPVPMTKRAIRRRGYNQSALLAKSLAKRIDVPYRSDLIVKTRTTPAQKELGVRERERNLSDSFRVVARKDCADKSILIVDDVLTTGATAGAMAQKLFAAKAERVLVLTVASVSRRDEF